MVWLVADIFFEESRTTAVLEMIRFRISGIKKLWLQNQTKVELRGPSFIYDNENIRNDKNGIAYDIDGNGDDDGEIVMAIEWR